MRVQEVCLAGLRPLEGQPREAWASPLPSAGLSVKQKPGLVSLTPHPPGLRTSALPLPRAGSSLPGLERRWGPLEVGPPLDGIVV